METHIEIADRRWSWTGTLLFHIALVSLLFLFKCGGGGGGNEGFGYTGLMSMDVAAIGNPIDGWGDNPEQDAPKETTPSQPVQESNAITDETATEESPIVSNKPNEKPVNKPKDPTVKPKPAEKPQQVSGGLNNALGGINKGGNGNTTGGGKQGAEDGKIDGKGVLNGGGSQGTGGGQGGGNGTGTGTGNGPGSGPGSGGKMNSEYTLTGRSIKRQPSISETAPDEGVVVVDIWVDKDGNVTKAVANAAKSTTSNGQLYKLAEKAAKNAKFSTSTANEQKGTIKITFKLY